MEAAFENIKAKLSSGHQDKNINGQRDELLAVDASTPPEHKSHFTHEAVGAAAAWLAMDAYQNHQQTSTGGKPSHAESKKWLASAATGLVIKLVEEKGLPFHSDTEKQKFVADAQAEATKDSKKALRDSGVYEQHELEPIEHDEQTANTVM